MAPASGCSIAGQSTFHQPTTSRHAEKGTRRSGRPETPVPERVVRPLASSCHSSHTQLRRAPHRNTVGLPQNVSPPDEFHLRPTRRSRQMPGTRTLPSINPVARRREELPRKRYPSPTHDVQELRPTILRREPSIALTIPSNIGINRRSVFPPRRPRKPRSTTSEEGVRRRPEYLKDMASEYERMANPSYSKHSTPVPKTHPYSCDSPVTTPTARRVRPVESISPASNRWSLSSDSSISSAWSSSSSMICPPTPTSDEPPPLYAREANYAWELEHAQREKELWRLRCLKMEDALGWAVERSPLIGPDDYRAPALYHDPGNIEEPLIDNSTSAGLLYDEDAGQTTVYADCEVIARDASFRRQMRNLDGVHVTHSSVTNLRKESKSRRADDIEWGKAEDQKRRKRARPFPMWAEDAPREMQAKEMNDINIRFVPDPDDCCQVTSIHHLPRQVISRGNSPKPSQTLPSRRKSC